MQYVDGLQKAEIGCAPGRLGARAAIEAIEDVAHVHVDRPRAEEQTSCDLLVGEPRRQQPGDLRLATGQAGPRGQAVRIRINKERTIKDTSQKKLSKSTEY